jgi:hypothetical protein
MPRISYVTNADYISGADTSSPENENIDLCQGCWGHRRQYVPAGLADEYIDDGDGQGAEAPSYDSDRYYCRRCDRQLWDLNDGCGNCGI